MDEFDRVMAELQAKADPSAVEGMARFGINPSDTLGVSIPILRKLAKETGRSHELALRLWDSGVHEARILAALVDDPAAVTKEQMEQWVGEFDSWDVCDQVCANLFDRTPFAYEKAAEWAAREKEFEKRAGFALMAALAWHDKKAPDDKFLPFLLLIEREAGDARNFVKKAVNWALRQIGKRDVRLNEAAVKTAGAIAAQDSSAAKWVASDALRELTGDKVRERLKA